MLEFSSLYRPMGVLALFLATACNSSTGGTAAAKPDTPATPDAPAPPPAPDAPSAKTSRTAAAPPTTAAEKKPGRCAEDKDCRLFSDYCTGCDCRALLLDEPLPPCPGNGVQCLRDPCTDLIARCVNGACVAEKQRK